MKKIVVALVLCLAMLTMTPGHVLAAAEKVDLEPDTINYPGLTGKGFVIFNNSAGVNNLQVTVSLKKADTSVTGFELDVYLFVDGSWYDDAAVGTMTLNKVGNGNFHINVSVEPDTYELFILLTKTGETANLYRAPWPRGTSITMDFK